MTTHLQNLVTEAVSLDREIAKQTERLKELKTELVQAAIKRDYEQLPTESGGRRWTAEGKDGYVARVNFPSPSLKPKIESEGKVIDQIKKLTGVMFSRLFVPTITFKPVEHFRGEARAILARADATKLIKLCQVEIALRVSFETTDRPVIAA